MLESVNIPDLANECGLDVSTVAKHIKKIRAGGMVGNRDIYRAIYTLYGIRPDQLILRNE